jgi:hypothetical protein
MKLTSRELNKLTNLVAEKTEECDFEEQEIDYQLFLTSLQDKLNDMYLEELNNIKELFFNDIANGRD